MMDLLIDGVIVTTISSVSDGASKNTDKIVKSTANTWQINRSEEEKTRDTKQGKMAEALFENYIQSNTSLLYISYDTLRNDDFKKHAPFDGILCKGNIDNSITEKFVDLLHVDILKPHKGNAVKLSGELLKYAREHDIHIVEIKSTKVNKTKKKKSGISDYSDSKQVERLIRIIKKNDDFLAYPKDKRSGNYETTNEYISYLINLEIIPTGLSEDKQFNLFCEYEKDNAVPDIFVRVYLDNDNDKALLMGYLDKEHFYSKGMCVKRMNNFRKSSYAIYLAKSLCDAISLTELESNI